MLLLFCPREVEPQDTRVAVTPDSAVKFKEVGVSVIMESGAGAAAGFADDEYTKAGCEIITDRGAAIKKAQMVTSVHTLTNADLSCLSGGAVTISFFDPFRNPSKTAAVAASGASAFSMELIPRTTLAQKMDALSSQASLGGYAAVLLAAMRMDTIFPMMMTPAGTLQASRVLVVGVGVAGLQAIATAKRLGARVTAFDTRPVVEEQVKSLGAKFLKIDLGETGQTEQGYARELTPEQLAKQRAGMARACAETDALITTAQVFGRPAPRIISAEMVAGMRSGSVIVDMAVASGGNVEGSEPGKEVVVGGVRILGADNLPASVPRHASLAYANNIFNLVSYFWKPEEGIHFDAEDEILQSSLVTHGGKIVNRRVLESIPST